MESGGKVTTMRWVPPGAGTHTAEAVGSATGPLPTAGSLVVVHNNVGAKPGRLDDSLVRGASPSI